MARKSKPVSARRSRAKGAARGAAAAPQGAKLNGQGRAGDLFTTNTLRSPAQRLFGSAVAADALNYRTVMVFSRAAA
jgi:hypothetical protein